MYRTNRTQAETTDNHAEMPTRILGRTGDRFWQDESFDRWIRNRSEWNRARIYIERNPVTAGLVRSPSEWPWSSASGRKQ